MSDILKSIAQFNDVPAGGSVATAHGLNVKGRPEIPDELKIDNGNFTVTADDIDVTVTNTGPGPDSVGVLCEMWHSIPRVFGLQDQDVQDSLPIRPFVGAGAASDLTGIMQSLSNLASGLSGDFFQVLLTPAPVAISAAQLNGAAPGTFQRNFSAECRNGAGDVMEWANFEVSEVPTANFGQFVPAEVVVDPEVGAPTVANSDWISGELTATVTFDTDGGATKVYAPGDTLSVELKMSTTDKFLGFDIPPVIQQFNVVA